MIDFENTFVEELPVKLTDVEVLDRSRAGAAISIGYAVKEREMKEDQKRRKLDLESLKAHRGQLDQAVHTGQEVRPVDCVYRANLRTERLEKVRTDTGEVFHSRALTKEELAAATQEPLRFPERHYEERTPVAKPEDPRKTAEEQANEPAEVVRDRELEDPPHDEDGVVTAAEAAVNEEPPPAPTPEPITISSDGMPDGNMPRQFELPAGDAPEDDDDLFDEDDE